MPTVRRREVREPWAALVVLVASMLSSSCSGAGPMRRHASLAGTAPSQSSSARPDGVTPDGASPNSASPDSNSPDKAAAPAQPMCPTPAPGTATAPLTGQELEHAREALVGSPARESLAAALGVSCTPTSQGFDVAVVQALARFQRRFGRFEDDVTGVLDTRTDRVLQMIYPSLREPGHPCEGETQGDAAAAADDLRACLLRWKDASTEQLAFMHQVYDVARARAASKRPFVIAADEVEVIERGPCPGKPSTLEPGCTRTQWAQRDAARAARRLLLAARSAFDADRKRHGQRNLMVFTGYRSAPFQLEIWEYHFPRRYRETKAARARAPGGPHGRAAARLLAQYYAGRTAPPGHSLHGRGIAIDFGCVTRKGEWIGSNGDFVKAWKGSYCFRWLKKNAGQFGFQLNESIDEPWHWEFKGKA